MILEIASRALESGDRDPDQIFQVAEKVGLKAHLINNLRAYATRSLFRIKARPQLSEEQLTETEHAAALIDNSYVERIEARILVRELLEALSPNGPGDLSQADEWPDVPRNRFGYEPEGAYGRDSFRVCKNALRRAVVKKLKP
jgi:hypothetical protein